RTTLVILWVGTPTFMVPSFGRALRRSARLCSRGSMVGDLGFAAGHDAMQQQAQGIKMVYHGLAGRGELFHPTCAGAVGLGPTLQRVPSSGYGSGCIASPVAFARRRLRCAMCVDSHSSFANAARLEDCGRGSFKR